MSTKAIKFLYWTPRILTILFIGFLALFALDVFIPDQTIMYYIISLFMHLIPNFLLGLMLFIAWKHERLGGILFIILAIFFTFATRSYTQWLNFLLIPLPVFIIGALFLWHSRLVKRREKHERITL